MTTPASALYLFQGSNIGPNGVLADAIDIPEMMYLIQKKFLGYPNTVPDILYPAELLPSVSSNIPNSFPFLHQTKLYSQFVPKLNQMYAGITYTAPTYSYITLSSNYGQDTTFINSNFVFLGCNLIPDMNASRYYSCNYPYIAFYSNLLISPLVYNKGRNPATLYSNFCTTYGHPLLINSISSKYDLTYPTILYTNNNSNQINPNDGYWLLDNDSGLLVFYDLNTTVPQVTASNPPRISFFRYEGLFGEASVTQGQYL